MWEFIWFALSKRQRKAVIWSLVIVLGYTLTGFLILPPIVRLVAVSQLSKQLDREVSIQKVKLNPFTFSATVRGLLIKDKDGKPFVSWDEVYVNFQLSSFFDRAWVFKEISATRPYFRAQMNRDGTFNFSDLVTKFSSPASGTAPITPAKPLMLHIGRLHIGRATVMFSDLTTPTPFARNIGPLDLTLNNFRTDPDNKNPYSFAGTTDSGETFSWRGFFYLDPLRSKGELTLDKISLNKYAPLYQNLVRFEIHDGSIALHANYDFELSASNCVAVLTNTAFALRDFKLGEPGASNNLIELPLLGVTGLNVDLTARQAEIGSFFIHGGNFYLQRNADKAINIVELAKPAATATNAPDSVLLLLHSVTNAVALLLDSTNQWRATIHDVDLTNCALHLEDLANSRPAKLDLDDIALSAQNISNVSKTNLTAALALRWNTNGTIHTKITASFSPLTADLTLALTNLDLGTLDPYLESKVNLLIVGSKLGMTGQLHLRTPKDALPEVTFQGDAWLDDLHIVDGTMGEDLLKWNSLRVNGIDANLNPQKIAIKEIALDDAYARLIVETNKAINLLTALQPAQTNAPVVAEPPATTSASNSMATTLPQIAVGSIVISNAAIRFTDRSITPEVNLTVGQAGGTIDGLSSEQLQHADLNLHALVDNVGPADITGQLNPFSGAQTNEIKISMKDVDLSPVSPYSGKFAGYQIALGKLNLDLEYELAGKKLAAKNVITLDQFTFGGKVNSPDATHLPVRLGVAILKDREGKIVLDVPVAGNLDDPRFHVGKVITRALVNILTKVATSPFSLLGAAFGGGGEELSYQDFAPGSAELSPADKKKLDSLVEGLYERPGLQLQISGSVEPASDRDGLQRLALEKNLRARQWLSLDPSERTKITPKQIVFAPGERADLVKKLFTEAQAQGKISPDLLAANTNLAAAAQVIAHKTETQKGATLLVQPAQPVAPAVTTAAPVSKLAPPDDPMEALLDATMPISNSDLETLATERAKAVRAYLLQTGKVEAARLFLTESQTGGVRSDGSRVYLQLQ
jgi:hypothetical protein